MKISLIFFSIKLQNIYKKDKVYKLGDFGFAKITEEN